MLDCLVHITDESKLNKIIAFKSVLDQGVVAHTISGYPVVNEEYVAMVKKADERVSSREYTTIEDLEKNRKVVICIIQLPYVGILKRKPI